MEGLSGLKTIESVVDCVNSFLTEHHEGTSVACQDISEGVKAVKSLCQENKAVCSKVQTSVASNSSLLSDLNQVQTNKSVFSFRIQEILSKPSEFGLFLY